MGKPQLIVVEKDGSCKMAHVTKFDELKPETISDIVKLSSYLTVNEEKIPQENIEFGSPSINLGMTKVAYSDSPDEKKKLVEHIFKSKIIPMLDSARNHAEACGADFFSITCQYFSGWKMPEGPAKFTEKSKLEGYTVLPIVSFYKRKN